MRFLVSLFMFTSLTTLLFGSDLILISKDGKPIPGYEMVDLSPAWRHANTLAPSGVGHGYPVAYYPVPDTRTGWVYDFSQSPRAIRAAYRKANLVGTPGRFTVVMFSATWCQPCLKFKRGKEPAAIRKLADFEVIDIDVSNPLNLTTVPTFVVYSPDNKETARYSGTLTAGQIKEIQ
jgi:thiol-disulfide isomerase/thioredoxin